MYPTVSPSPDFVPRTRKKKIKRQKSSSSSALAPVHTPDRFLTCSCPRARSPRLTNHVSVSTVPTCESSPGRWPPRSFRRMHRDPSPGTAFPRTATRRLSTGLLCFPRPRVSLTWVRAKSPKTQCALARHASGLPSVTASIP